MHRRSFIKKAGAAGLIAWFQPVGWWGEPDAHTIDDLEKRFRAPLPGDHPQAMWFWMNGNVTREGITLDLEAMQRVGIRGVLNFDAGISIPEGPVAFGTDEWIALKKHAIQEAARLGIRYGMHNCPGWSSSGGPWITPELSMKQLTWSELYVAGGKELNTTLPLPFHKHGFYRDIAVLAYPSLPGEMFLHHYAADTAAGAVPMEAITGGQAGGVPVYGKKEKDPAWLRFTFDQPAEVRFLSFIISAVDDTGGPLPPGRTSVVLEASDDGNQFRTLAVIPTGMEEELRAGDKWITYDITPARAKFFRLRSAAPRRYKQVRFSGIKRLEKFLEKTGNRFQFSGTDTSPLYTDIREESNAAEAIPQGSITDISSFMNAKGNLQWKAPPGAWTILRFGYTTTLSVNKAAPRNGTGLECDKFDREAIRFHFSRMMALLQPALQHVGKLKPVLEIDSYEAGPQTWTENFAQEFRLRRGYDLIAFLPATTGRMLANRDHTEQFLWDFRRTQADLIADNYYKTFTELCHAHGFASMVQPYDKGPFEEMQAGSMADLAMGEMWYGLSSLLQGNAAVRRTARLAASIMNNKGQRVVAAESFTSEPESSRWQEHPFSLKLLADKLFCEGINNIFIHRFVHQPHPSAAPGMTMGPWGIHFDRTNTWFEKAGGWMQYLARCQSLLQPGWPVKDLVYFTGEESHVYTRVNRAELSPAPPAGYDWGLVDAGTIIKKFSIEKGQIELPHGMRYRVLVLQDFKALSLPLLQKIRELVETGLVLFGKKPKRLTGLQHVHQQEGFSAITAALWPDADEHGFCDHRYGKGRVVWAPTLEPLLQSLKVQPDFTATARSASVPLLFAHRTIEGTEIYFVCNQRRTTEDLVCSFRVSDRQPEIWDPSTGGVIPAPFYEQDGGLTRVPLQLEPYGARFLVFRAPASGKGFTLLQQNGEAIWGTGSFSAAPPAMVAQAANNFTIVMWAKPEMNIMLRPSVHMGNIAHPYTDYYALYPPQGRRLYGPGHATCGIAVGRNGIAVWENEQVPVLALVAETHVSGWSHVAVVYRDGSPSIYLNGKVLGSGTKSSFVVHPATGDASLQEAGSYYNGDREGLQWYARVAGEEELQVLAKQPVPHIASSAQDFFSYGPKNSLLFWRPGNYALQQPSGEKIFIAMPSIDPPMVLGQNWQLEFPSGTGIPSVRLRRLVSLHRIGDSHIKYFSGTVVYKKDFHILQSRIREGRKMFLDLGRVEVIAQVILNGKDLGLLWLRPYRAEITGAVRAGLNHLEIRVTNLWPNRLIGDEQVPESHLFSDAGSSGFEHLAGAGFEASIGQAIKELPDWYLQGKPKPNDGRTAFTTWKHYRKDDPLLESGLIGPVEVRTAVAHRISGIG